jgi:nicotinamide-nucleotide adenylyltransferase
LLFSTHNADKAPSPASFVQRIALMTALAEDLSRSLKSSVASSAQLGDSNDPANISIDIGLTKEPYYSDKSIAIANTEPLFYPSKPIHVHLVGYDTLIRFCNPKYYQDYKPPLSALKPFFEAGHKLRVTQRPYVPNDKSSAEFGTVEEQQRYLKGLQDGDLEKEGLLKSWAERIDMVEGGEGVGISSTRVRNAAKEGNWDEVGRLCTEEVSAWVQSQKLYKEDASGKKMMG